MFTPSWGGWRPRAGRKPKYYLDAHRRLGIAIEVTEAMRTRQEAERHRQYEGDPRTTLIRDQQRRIEHHASRHVERVQAMRYFAPHSKAIDALGRFWGCTVGSYKAEAIREVAERHNLPVRVVRDCYREFRKHVPEPERLYTVFDEWWWQRPVAKLRQAVDEFYRQKLYRFMVRDHEDIPLERRREPTDAREREIQQHENAIAGAEVARHERVERHRKRKR
jgi:hypothetical protein